MTGFNLTPGLPSYGIREITHQPTLEYILIIAEFLIAKLPLVLTLCLVLSPHALSLFHSVLAVRNRTGLTTIQKKWNIDLSAAFGGPAEWHII